MLDHASELPVSGTITRLAVGDVDRDGHLDIAAASDSGKLAIFGGRGDGTFVDRQQVDLTAPAVGVGIGDLDADGRPEIVVASKRNELLVFAGSDDGRWGAPSSYPSAGASTTSLATVVVRDIDEDGKAEVLVLDETRVAVFRHHEGEGLQLVESYTWEELGLKGVDGDVDPDLLPTARGFGLVLRLTDGPSSEAPMALGSLGISDLDHDGRRDLAVASGVVAVHLNRGKGTFEHLDRDRAPLGSRVFYETDLDIADLDCDGNQDLALATTSDPGLLMGTGDGWFTIGLGVPEARWSVRLGDFDEDGFSDVAAADHEPSAVHILLNRAR